MLLRVVKRFINLLGALSESIFAQRNAYKVHTAVEGFTVTTYAVNDSEKHFYLHEGGSLGSLEELFTELQTMDEHVFRHHVNAERNDFANWVRDVMHDRSLARNIALSSERDQMLKILFINLFR